MALNERKLSKSELDKREDIVLKMKKNKRDLVKKYGKDAEAVMYGRATNMAKKATKEARDPKITELLPPPHFPASLPIAILQLPDVNPNLAA